MHPTHATPYRSLVQQLIVKISLMAIVILVVALGIEAVLLQRQTEKKFADLIEEIVESNVPTLALALWDIEPQALESQITGLSHRPEIGYVQLNATTGQKFESGDRSLANQDTARHLTITHTPSGMNLGQLTLVLNPAYFWNTFFSLAWEIAAGYVLLMTAICLFILLILSRDLKKPLRSIANFAANLTSENLTTPLHINRPVKGYRDEINQLANGFDKLQNSLRTHIDDLNRLLAEREVNQHRLELANQQSQAANLAKSQFLATVSHELRTPLNAILGMAQILQEPGLSEAHRIEYSQIIEDSSRSLNLLISDLLDIAQIESNKLVLRSEPCHVETILNDIAALFQQNAKMKNLDLRLQWSGPPNQYYRTDGLRLRQMISNLVSNAIKFTPSGFVLIEGCEVERNGAEALLMFSVKDSGMGIPQEKLNLLFQRFSQIDSTHTRGFMGTGLGLSIVESLAKRMGGEVGVESVEGQGSRFWFRIQTVLLNEEGAALSDFPESEGVKTPHKHVALEISPTLSAEKTNAEHVVMVVEDNPINQKIVGNVLTRLGVQIDFYNNGLDALNAITQGVSQPNLILMDMQMPVMDGLEATEKIRLWEQTSGTARIPIVGLTAGAGQSSASACIQSGMDEVLLKPVDIDILHNTIVKLVA